jgi:DNA-binding MarR family transcriptional regulator
MPIQRNKVEESRAQTKMLSYTKGSKFYHKSLTTLLPLLKMVSEGYAPKDLKKALGISKSLLSYRLNRLQNLNLIEFSKGYPSNLSLTEGGKHFLAMYYSKSSCHPIVRVENVRFKAPIVRMPTIPVEWNKVKMKNWSQYCTQLDGIKIKVNDGKSPTIEYIVPATDDFDNNPTKLYCMLLQQCQMLTTKLEELFGMKIGGPMQLSDKGEWVVFDPVAKSITENLGRINIDGVAKINASKPLRRGEFEFFSPLAAAEYLSMPYHVRVLEYKMDKLLHQNSYYENN